MSYTRQVLSGFGWQTVLKIAAAVVAFLKISVLARLLSPADFGLFSLVAIALGVSEATTQTGINITILQSKHSIDYFLNTAWVISIVRGLAIAVLMVLLSFGLSNYFQEPQLLFLITLTALVPLIKGFINPSIILLHKEMRFFRDSLYRFSLLFVDALLAVAIGLITHSVLAFIGAMIGAALFEVVISFIFFSTRPRFEFLSSRAKAIFQNSKWLSLTAFFGYLNDNLDDFLIGKLTDPTRLGFYHNGYALSHRANYDVAKSIHHSTMPVFTELERRKQSVNHAFWKSFRASAVILLLTTLPLLIFPQLLVEIVLGDKWLAVVPILPWLGMAGFIHAIALLCYTYLLARGKYVAMNLHLALSLMCMVTLILAFTPTGGVLGAVIGLVIARLLSFPVVALGVWNLIKPSTATSTTI